MANTFSSLLDLVYPIGSIYIATRQKNKSLPNPGSCFGGSWTHIQNRFLFSGDADESKYALESLGGEFSHTLSIQEMPSHDHAFQTDWSGAGWAGDYSPMGFLTINNGNDGNGGTLAPIYYTNIGVDIIHNTGGGKAHNNMPPYAVVRAWKRSS